MNIIVCIKQVPDTTELQMDKETKTLKRESAPAILNPFDEYAIEEGVRIREQQGGRVTALTMGPLQAKAEIIRAFSLGVDDGILISDRAFAGSDTYCTAKILAAAVRKIGAFNLIICGKQAIDGDTAQVGPEMAELLDIPHVAYIKEVKKVDGKSMIVQKTIEEGYETLEMALPGLITVLKDINRPRLPSYRLYKKGKQGNIPVWGLEDLHLSAEEVGLQGSPTTVDRIYIPKMRARGEMLQGTSREKSKAMVNKIQQSLRSRKGEMRNE